MESPVKTAHRIPRALQISGRLGHEQLIVIPGNPNLATSQPAVGDFFGILEGADMILYIFLYKSRS